MDFIVSSEQRVFPLEVIAGVSRKKKSLLVYEEKFSADENQPIVLSRTSLRNFACDGKMINYPLYAVHLFPRFRA